MSVRFKITFLFSIIVCCILGMLCTSVYLFFSSGRERYIDSRLTNMAITTGRFLSKEEIFNRDVISKIDSLTAISFTRKTLQAYDSTFKKIYSFNDDEDDTLILNTTLLNEAKNSNKIYTRIGKRDAVVYNYYDGQQDLLIVAAGYDLYGHKNLKNLFVILLISFFVGTLIAIISGYLFSRKLLYPIGKIADDVNEISAYKLTKRIDSGSSPDEWNHLAQTLNKLLDRLQESFEIQSRFISNASHEVFTPLTAISSQLELALDKNRSANEYKKTMHSVYQDIRHMSKLTLTLLEFAKASGSKSGIEIKPVRIDEVILQLVKEINKINAQYTVNLDFSKLPTDHEDLVIMGNEGLLFTAFKNVALNACKYSDDQKVNISLFADGKEIIISIGNTGPGIPQNEFENIFQPFYRIEKDRVSDDGFGLGLSLSKRIIKLHYGEIIVNSIVQGETVFTIHFRNTKKEKLPLNF